MSCNKGIGACRAELLALAKKRASDPTLGGGEGLLVLSAAEILADGPSRDDWVREMLHRIKPERLERKQAPGAITGESKEDPQEDEHDSLSQLLTAFHKYGCNRGPIIACALSELQLPPQQLRLERIVQCIKVLERCTKSGKHPTARPSLACSPFLRCA